MDARCIASISVSIEPLFYFFFFSAIYHYCPFFLCSDYAVGKTSGTSMLANLIASILGTLVECHKILQKKIPQSYTIMLSNKLTFRDLHSESFHLDVVLSPTPTIVPLNL